MTNSEVYRHPHYYAIGYRWNTESECAFIEACLKAYGPPSAKRLLDLGCGTGRHLLELAKRGYQMTGMDASPEMVAFVKEAAQQARLDDPRVVEHQQVPRAQHRRQLAEDAVGGRLGGAIEQARGAALGCRVLGDQLGWQVEIKIAERVNGGHANGALKRHRGPQSPNVCRRRESPIVPDALSGLAQRGTAFLNDGSVNS